LSDLQNPLRTSIEVNYQVVKTCKTSLKPD